jgi:hypothetical protein
MPLHNFIFSSKPLYRVGRHGAFWLARIGFVTSAHGFFHYDSETTIVANLWGSLRVVPGLILLGDIPLCYLVAYVLAPRFLDRKKYGAFILLTILGTLLLLVVTILYIYRMENWSDLNPHNELFEAIWLKSSAFLFAGAIICLVFLSLKMLKNWRWEQASFEALVQANTEAEIRLLQSQVHPHFFFNTLNNIYSFTLEESPIASKLVHRLSEIFRYSSKHSNAALVPLGQELQVLENYIELEKVRYGERLDLEIDIQGPIAGRALAPMLMLPFLENSFKHGASRTVQSPWIKLRIHVTGETLRFILINGKPPDALHVQRKKGLGLANVKKRLDLIYGTRHHLQLADTIDTFTVSLRLPLCPQP